MIRILVVDDSPLVRKIASDIIDSDSGMEVVATASSAEIAMKKIDKFKPDVITMDIEMPGMGGIAAISEIMSTRPTPIIILSALAKRGAELTMQALELGAVDFIPKPTSSLSGGITDIARVLVEKVKEASKISVKEIEKPAEKYSNKKLQGETEPEEGISLNGKSQRKSANFDLVSIGTSTGGPIALRTMLTQLSANFPVGVVVVQHMPPVFTKAFANRLDTLCKIKVKEAEDGDLILPGKVLIAPGDFHMTVTKFDTEPKVILKKWKPVSGHRPSVDVLISSVAREYGNKAIGVIMTGMGKDGAEGMSELKKRGGYVIAQDEGSSTIYGMNREVIRNGDADEVVPVYDIPGRIMNRLHS
jgi:two-component system chemotaxis response regulator CheB